MHLNELQIDQVLKHLDQDINVSSKSKEEILDHICSQIENEMLHGSSFKSAFDKIFNPKQIDELILLDKRLQRIQTPANNYLNYSLIAGITLSVFFLFFSFYKNPLQSAEPVQEKFSPQSQDNQTPSLWPVKSNLQVSSEFGMRMHPIKKKRAFHFGIDIPAKHGEPVLATADGKVIEIGYQAKGYGNYIIIEHNSSLRSFYSQLSKVTISKGDTVKKGQNIGQVGSSGLSTNPHLHFEIINDGKKVDPLKYIKA